MPSFTRKIGDFIYPLRQVLGMIHDENARDRLMWSYDLGSHSRGEFSFATVQANAVMEDYGQIETGDDAIFFGVYDGHNGHLAAQYINDRLFDHLLSSARQFREVNSVVVLSAIDNTETGFQQVVEQRFSETNRMIAATGSCCLISLIWRGTMFVANLGNSRAVLCYSEESIEGTENIVHHQVTNVHSANRLEIREYLLQKFTNVRNIVRRNRQGVWCVKGVQEVTKSIGDVYLKLQGYAFPSSYTDLHVPDPIRRPLIEADPEIFTRQLEPHLKFIIFASNGLWKHLTNEEVVEIVRNNRRKGIAKRIIKEAVRRVAGERNIEYRKLVMTEKGERLRYHDDMSVIVVYFDHVENPTNVKELSIKPHTGRRRRSKFNSIRDL